MHPVARTRPFSGAYTEPLRWGSVRSSQTRGQPEGAVGRPDRAARLQLSSYCEDLAIRTVVRAPCPLYGSRLVMRDLRQRMSTSWPPAAPAGLPSRMGTPLTHKIEQIRSSTAHKGSGPTRTRRHRTDPRRPQPSSRGTDQPRRSLLAQTAAIATRDGDEPGPGSSRRCDHGNASAPTPVPSGPRREPSSDDGGRPPTTIGANSGGGTRPAGAAQSRHGVMAAKTRLSTWRAIRLARMRFTHHPARLRHPGTDRIPAAQERQGRAAPTGPRQQTHPTPPADQIPAASQRRLHRSRPTDPRLSAVKADGLPGSILSTVAGYGTDTTGPDDLRCHTGPIPCGNVREHRAS